MDRPRVKVSNEVTYFRNTSPMHTKRDDNGRTSELSVWEENIIEETIMNTLTYFIGLD